MVAVFKNNRGIALFIVLWVLMLLWVIVGEFSFTVRSQINIVSNFKEITKAQYYAVAGINQAIASIMEYKELKSKGDRDAFKWEIASEVEQTSASKGGYSVKISNESGKININTDDKRMLKTLLKAAGVDDDKESIIVDSMLDWRDENNLHRTNGAEDDYYQGLENPYECRDGDFRSVDELLLVRGVTREVYNDLKGIITIYGGSDAAQSNSIIKGAGGRGGENKININFISRDLLIALPGMTGEIADSILAYRKEKKFDSINELQNVVDAELVGKIASYLTVSTSSFYRMEAVGFFKDRPSSSLIEALVKIDGEAESGFRIVKWAYK